MCQYCLRSARFKNPNIWGGSDRHLRHFGWSFWLYAPRNKYKLIIYKTRFNREYTDRRPK